jgi:phosphatidylglycerophosphate synthase
VTTLPPDSTSWQTKSTDRFVLKWIKLNLSARITPRLVGILWLRPWMLTLCSTVVGTAAGVIFGLGWGWPAGLLAGMAQIIDGVDGQFARLTGRDSRAGAFLDSVLDRYPDGAMVIGMIIYLVRLPLGWPVEVVLVLGGLAVIGSGLISYSTARAETLGLDLGPPTLASKGTRTTVMVVCALSSVAWPALPAAALVYLAIHPNVVVAARLIQTHRAAVGGNHE